jgi:NhaA family Na+:H+ antiporter
MPDRRVRVPKLGKAIPPIGSDFVSLEAASGIVLLLATAAALVWANTATASYQELWHHTLRVGSGDLSITEDYTHWVNEGLMTIFFFVVGLEIKRELVVGELRDRRTAALPAVAAVGGMVVPAALYLVVNASGAGADGWAIPMATDIAFAMGVLAILGARVPPRLKLFMLTLAIVDDIGAIVVIALLYSGGIDLAWLAGATLTLGAVLVMSRLGADRALLYVIPALVLWVCLLESGVEATLAGVILGLVTPAHPRGGRPVLLQLEHALHPVSSFVVVPLFALANAGVVLTADSVDAATSSRITIGIVVGLVVGKFVGILGATAIGVRSRVGRLPDGIQMSHVGGVAALGGIGFTVALFVSDLTFRGAQLDQAKLGVLGASALAAGFGILVLSLVLRDAPRTPLPAVTTPHPEEPS